MGKTRTNWIFRHDVAWRSFAVARLATPEPMDRLLTETTKAKLRMQAGDRIVGVRGFGAELRFDMVAEISSVLSKPSGIGEEHGWTVWQIHLAEVSELPDDRKLAPFAYSLERISNFTRPALNVRHHGRLTDNDVDTLLSGVIAPRRSQYFGLLRHLPFRWRRYAEAQVEMRLATERFDEAARDRPPPYAREWLHLSMLARRMAITPAVLAAQAFALSAATDWELLSGIAELTPSGGHDLWLDRLLRYAGAQHDALARVEAQLQIADSELHDEEEPIRKWRPHHW